MAVNQTTFIVTKAMFEEVFPKLGKVIEVKDLYDIMGKPKTIDELVEFAKKELPPKMKKDEVPSPDRIAGARSAGLLAKAYVAWKASQCGTFVDKGKLKQLIGDFAPKYHELETLMLGDN